MLLRRPPARPMVHGHRRSPDGITLVEFFRTKYGPELLVDTAWVHDMPTFLVDGSPHRLSFYDILLVTRGWGTFGLDQRHLEVCPGAVLFTTPGQVREWRVRDLDGICLFFTAAFIDEFFADPGFLPGLPFFHHPAMPERVALDEPAAAVLQERLEAMAAEIRGLRPDTEHVLRAMLYEVLLRLRRAFEAEHGTPSGDAAVHPVVGRFRDLIETRFRRCHEVAAYAEALCVSPGHLNALCHRHLGRSAKAAIMDRVLLEARRLLRYTDQPAKRIAWDLGFQDPSYFARCVRRMTGLAPSGLRAGPPSPRSGSA